MIDGNVLPAHPFDPAAPAVSDDVPIMIGGTKDESAIFLAPDDAVWNRTVTEDDLRKRIAAVAGDATDELLAYYKRRDPAASPSDRLITALTASNFGVRSVLLAERKAARRRAPVWMYRFDWETPAFGGRLKSPHSVDVPFVFDTLHVIGEATASPAPRRSPTACRERGPLSRATAIPETKRSRHGRPMPPSGAPRCFSTTTCRVVDDPDGEVRPLWSKVATA